MKTRRPNPGKKKLAMTLVELIAVLAMIATLAMMFNDMAMSTGSKSKVKRIVCMNNLKQLPVTDNIWADSRNDNFPFGTAATNGLVMKSSSVTNAWICFQVMSNELATPKILICPADREHQPPATNFSAQLAGHISYFLGPQNQSDPQGLRSGDDNFEIDGMPVKPGWLEPATNTLISWSATRHHNAGNLLLNDGSIQSVTTSMLRQAGFGANLIIIP